MAVVLQQSGTDNRCTLAPYCDAMHHALRGLRLTEQQCNEAVTSDQADVSTAMLSAAWAEVQFLVRQAKRECGLPVHAVTETEQRRASMLAYMRGGNDRGSSL